MPVVWANRFYDFSIALAAFFSSLTSPGMADLRWLVSSKPPLFSFASLFWERLATPQLAMVEQ